MQTAPIQLQVTWYKSNVNSSGYTEVVSGTKYKVHSNGSLSIVDVQKEDAGTYEVQISNSAGSASQQVEVDVNQHTG